MDINTVKKILNKEEIDYQSLLSCLQGYASPRDKISRWLKNGDLIRVKKGLYVFGAHVAERPYSVILLANLIYGPSAISLQYALSYYHLIPERVSVITSITPKRNKYFKTPVGIFSYHYLPAEKYSIGIEWLEIEKECHCFMASPEKALCDLIYFSSFENFFNSFDSVQQWLLEDLRIHKEDLKKLSMTKLQQLKQAYNHPSINDFVNYFRR
jgi:hypothetical protein